MVAIDRRWSAILAFDAEGRDYYRRKPAACGTSVAFDHAFALRLESELDEKRRHGGEIVDHDAQVYPHYVTKVERKGRTKAELDEVIEWLTGFDESGLSGHLAAGTTFEAFFADARLNPHASLITGVVCGVRVEHVDDPLMQKIRYLDKLVDELAKGKSMDRILRA